MESVQELADYFVYHITQASVGIEGRMQNAITSIQLLQEKGWRLDEIKHELDQFKQDYPRIACDVYHLDEIMGKKQQPNNLLDPNIFYYHNLLRNVSPPTRLVRDKEGRLVRQSQAFYLEMKQRFTLQELLDYWYQQMNIKPNEHMIRQDEGKFKYILGNYTIDEVLFSIDVSKTLREERQLQPLRNAFELDKYIEDARVFIRSKENIHKMQGINREFKREEENYYGSGHPYN